MLARYTFPDLVSFTDAASNPVQKSGLSYHAMYVDGQEGDWYGLPASNVRLSDVVALANSGWNDGSVKMNKAISKVEPPAPVNIRRRPAWGDHGDEVNMDRVRMGMLDKAWRFTPKRAVGVSKRNITITVDAIAPSVLEAEKMFWRGAAAVVLADALTEAGYSVQLVSAFRGECLANRTVCRVVVKHYSTPLDIQTATATMALPAFFRCLGHAWGYGHLKLGEGIFDGGWIAADLSESDVSDLAEGAVMFMAHQGLTDQTLAQAWIDECVKMLDAESGSMGNE